VAAVAGKNTSKEEEEDDDANRVESN